MDPNPEDAVRLDTYHPLAAVSKRNAESSPFLRLNAELRIMIYEFAVAINEDVTVHQVTEHSNKFVWGRSRWEDTWYPFVEVNEEQQPLTVVSLSRACRQIYKDLERWPVFYRVNTFKFPQLKTLTSFLAAITPQRRGFIRFIELSFTGEPILCPNADWLIKWRGSKKRLGHSLALLSQCKNLRKLSMTLGSYEYYRWYIGDYLALAMKPHDAPTPWNLPFISPEMILPGGDVLVLGESDPISAPLSLKIQQLPATTQQKIVQINTAMFARQSARQPGREPGQKYEWPQWFKAMDSTHLVTQAIVAQRLDFSGENRLARDPLQNVGPVSSRTRRNHSTFNSSLGILQREIPKYTPDGNLTWNFTGRILGIRWNDVFDPEFEVEWVLPTRVPATSWEPLRAIWINEVTDRMIRGFYVSVFHRKTPPSKLVEQMRNTPSPNLVFKHIGESFQDGISEAMSIGVGRRRKFTKEEITDIWISLNARWESHVAKLEKKVEAAEEKAAKKAKKEAQKASKGKRKAVKD
ncbi:hypothetical protein F5Y05DRAFT_420083 [Hypoxylon sp. FL0543]|nr:hypothetical protein F5Y05DRAFT_420083 [Hypoxylon sp. FL0543]